jgi:simple sugar transport system ATP-binding protein
LGAKVQTLSGGNQQKSLIARLIEADLRILIFDEPTKGVDVGAIESIHKTIRSLASEGKAVLVVSSYLPEIMTISDRVLVMRDGELVANFTAEEVAEDKVMAAAFG